VLVTNVQNSPDLFIFCFIIFDYRVPYVWRLLLDWADRKEIAAKKLSCETQAG
jgi:hypothetical protein